MTDDLITVEVQNSHLYPGALGTVLDPGHAGSFGEARSCLVLFADGTAVHGSIRAVQPADVALDVPAYVTARGTRIPEKSWMLTLTPSGEGRAAMRVRKRLQAARS